MKSKLISYTAMYLCIMMFVMVIASAYICFESVGLNFIENILIQSLVISIFIFIQNCEESR